MRARGSHDKPRKPAGERRRRDGRSHGEGHRLFGLMVLGRDLGRCVGCGTARSGLACCFVVQPYGAAHLKWDLSNGLTLCKNCRQRLTGGGEAHYQAACRALLAGTGERPLPEGGAWRESKREDLRY